MKNKYFLSILFVCLLNHIDFVKSYKTHRRLDFKNLAKAFCREKRENFCSIHNLKMMFDIEEKQQKSFALERQLKRIEHRINENIFRTNEKFTQIRGLTNNIKLILKGINLF